MGYTKEVVTGLVVATILVGGTIFGGFFVTEQNSNRRHDERIARLELCDQTENIDLCIERQR